VVNVVMDSEDICREWSEWAMRLLEEGGRDAPSEGRGTSREAMLRKGANRTGRAVFFFCLLALHSLRVQLGVQLACGGGAGDTFCTRGQQRQRRRRRNKRDDVMVEVEVSVKKKPPVPSVHEPPPSS
jgi:hypothetical protein